MADDLGLGRRAGDWHADKILELTDKAAALNARANALETMRVEDRNDFRAFQAEMRAAVNGLREEIATVTPRILTALAEHEEKLRGLVAHAAAPATPPVAGGPEANRTAGHEVAIKALDALKWPLVAIVAVVGGPGVLRYLMGG
jgi:hypothetical protein